MHDAAPRALPLRIAIDAGRDFLYLLAVLCMSIIGFVAWVTCGSVTLGLLVLVVGLFVWLGSTYVFRFTAGVDRRLAAPGPVTT